MKRCLIILLVSALLLSACSEGGEGSRDADIEYELSMEEELLKSMSMDEKLGQLIMSTNHLPGSFGEAAELGIGGICLYALAFQDKSPAQVRAMCEAIQRRSALPMLLAVDEEGGSVCRVSIFPKLREKPFLSPMELYKEGGLRRVTEDCEEKCRFLLDLGINVNLAPVCDIPLSEKDYIYERCIGTEPELTRRYVLRVIDKMQREGMGSCLKHFPGYGGSADTHQGMACDPRPAEDFMERDFIPFKAGIEAGADAVLVSHNIVSAFDPELPASLSPEVHRILRDELGFQGVIISDDLSMQAIQQFTGGENAAVQAFLAGNDIVCCWDFETAHAQLKAAVEDGRISPEQVDEAVLRILNWKSRLGLDIFGT